MLPECVITGFYNIPYAVAFLGGTLQAVASLLDEQNSFFRCI